MVELGANSVTLAAKFDCGGYKFADTGFCLNTIGAPTVKDYRYSCYEFGGSISDLRATIDNLTDATTYYVKAYAISSTGVVIYSDMSTVVTTDYKIEAQSCLSTITPFCVSVAFKAIFDYDESSKVLDMGVVINTDKDPESATAVKYPIAIQRDMIDLVCSGLKPNTTYYAWSYIETEECGVAYSRENIFKTNEDLLAVKFNEYNSSRWLVGMHYASVACAIDFDDSKSSLVEAGLMWSQSSGAKLGDVGVGKIADPRITTRGSYTICATGLMSAITYYFRAYTQLADGTVEYSDEIEIKTYQYKGQPSMVSTGSFCNFDVNAPTKNRYWVWGNNSDYNTTRQKSDPVWGGTRMKNVFAEEGYSFSSDNTYTERCTWHFNINKEQDTLLMIQFTYNDLPRSVESGSKYSALFAWKVKTNQANGQIVCTNFTYKEANFPTVTESQNSRHYKNAETLMENENIGPMLRAYFEFLFGTEDEPHPLQMDVHSIVKDTGEYSGRFIMLPISQKRNPNFDFLRNGAAWGSVSNMPLPIWSSEE